MHKYRCAMCNKIFESSSFAQRCPICGGKVLIHLEGDMPKKRSSACAGGSCSTCHGCGR
ncbi:hypothetical protein SAMN05444368_0687 [Acetomicrobium flavidum]|uniref:Zinc ribbon domain-containing protein n=1 Tax=Acetomicrobium flavidum TaxID=49896 RepID=A0ABY1JC58_9BACT|nr:hypothetical protein SAMN05444368_0687 [Acetomicrobium flavidum]